MSPLLFNPIHGVNVRICGDDSVAERSSGDSGGGILFSDRPVKINEKVCIRCVQISSNSYEGLRFGFSKNDPKSLQSNLGFYTGFASRAEFWAKDLYKDQFKVGDILYYFVNKDGDVHLGINGEEKEVFLYEVKPHGSLLWALIEIFGDSTRIELVDENRKPEEKRKPVATTGDLINLTPDEDYDPGAVGLDGISLLVHSKSGGLTCSDVDFPASQFYQNVVPKSMHFHRTKGTNAHIGASGLQASLRKTKDFLKNSCSNGYTFTARPLEIGESFVIKIQKHNPEFSTSMAMGITSCDPQLIRSHELPDDPSMLLDRPEYWVVQKNVAESCVAGDELCFTFTYSGEILMSKNGESSDILMHIDDSVPLWAFFDLHGSTSEIILLGKICVANTKCSSGGMRPPSAPLWNTAMSSRSMSEEEPVETATSSSKGLTSTKKILMGSTSTSAAATSDCTICCERPVDSVFLPCGHMCMCYKCAKFYGDSTAAQGGCPICRESFSGIVRTYKS